MSQGQLKLPRSIKFFFLLSRFPLWVVCLLVKYVYVSCCTSFSSQFLHFLPPFPPRPRPSFLQQCFFLNLWHCGCQVENVWHASACWGAQLVTFFLCPFLFFSPFTLARPNGQSFFLNNICPLTSQHVQYFHSSGSYWLCDGSKVMTFGCGTSLVRTRKTQRTHRKRR